MSTGCLQFAHSLDTSCLHLSTGCIQPVRRLYSYCITPVCNLSLTTFAFLPHTPPPPYPTTARRTLYTLPTCGFAASHLTFPTVEVWVISGVHRVSQSSRYSHGTRLPGHHHPHPHAPPFREILVPSPALTVILNANRSQNGDLDCKG